MVGFGSQSKILKSRRVAMRLVQDKIDNLKASISFILPNSKIYLFGSRVDESKKGGDIDILILANRKLSFIEKAKVEKQFFKQFGEQKLDLISFSFDETNTFKEVVLEEAIEL
jgi:predicted nucleotidyltransferase